MSDITPEERAKLRAEWKKRLVQIGVARQAILDTKQGAGEIECPVCKSGRLRFSVARSNGHVHAKCTTRLCMSWME
jgi:hypothetical protein